MLAMKPTPRARKSRTRGAAAPKTQRRKKKKVLSYAAGTKISVEWAAGQVYAATVLELRACGGMRVVFEVDDTYADLSKGRVARDVAPHHS
jgi:hypothetical protein